MARNIDPLQSKKKHSGAINMKCPACGAAELVTETRDMAHTYRSHSTLIRAVHGAHCPACGESVLDAMESERVMAQVQAFRAGVDASMGNPAQ